VLGKKDRNEKMFYYVKIDELIPEDHLLRLIHRYVDLGFIRKKVEHLYGHTGRPAIDPEVLLERVGFFIVAERISGGRSARRQEYRRKAETLQ